LSDWIKIKGARQHNLRNIDVDFPRGLMTAVSGLSGSGKSSLVFDTLYAEGQRSYVESLSTYARQFLERLPKPDVDWIEGISPAIAIQQRNAVTSGRSTVGTVTEINDYLRVLWARTGKIVCPDCRGTVAREMPAGIWRRVRKDAGEDAAVMICYPLEFGPEGAAVGWWEPLLAQGFQRVILAAETVRLEDAVELPLPKGADSSVVVDRLKISSRVRARFIEAVELALAQGAGKVTVRSVDGDAQWEFSGDLSCAGCGRVFLDPTPRLFSFNSPEGACPACKGFGNHLEFDEGLIIPDPDLSLRDGAVKPWSTDSFRRQFTGLLRFCARRKIPMDKPFSGLTRKHQLLVLEGGDKSYMGIIPYLAKMRQEMKQGHHRFFTRRYMGDTLCRACGGSRLRPEAQAVKVQGMDLGQVGAMSVTDALARLEAVRLSKAAREVAGEIREEILHRLGFLDRVGLGYLTLDRLTRTLSGGEAQRIHLANALGSRLVDTLYVLDEPTCGLHAADVDRLVATLRDLVDGGNTVVVVEHDLGVLAAADYFVELGPGAGSEGGELVHAGPVCELLEHGDTLTARHLRGEVAPLPRRPAQSERSGHLVVKGARLHNLRNIDVKIPLHRFVALTGLSGSGKSSLLNGCIYDGLTAKVLGGSGRQSPFTALQGGHGVDQVIRVDQSPIGKTSRSNPASYLQVLGPIRELFAHAPEAVARGYAPGRFSFNTAGGRCATCQGLGFHRVEMQFMADIEVPCEDCRGSRFSAATLDIRYKGMNIAQVLDLTIADALAFFGDVAAVSQRLWLLKKVGLGYLHLGQPAPTLSGGESQRLKIARELAQSSGRNNLYLLDEPTTGLHAEDVRALVAVLHELVAQDHSVLVIEHNLDLIAQADWIIDLGPGGGNAGGRLVAEGTPAQVAAVSASLTGQHLRRRS